MVRRIGPSLLAAALLLLSSGPALAKAPQYSVTVVRVSNIGHLPPLRRVITAKASVQALYRAMMAVRRKPTPFNYMCPMDNGVSYRVSFDLGGRIVNAHVDGSGCRFVHLSGTRVLWASGSGAAPFWSLFGSLLQLSPAQLRGGLPY